MSRAPMCVAKREVERSCPDICSVSRLQELNGVDQMDRWDHSGNGGVASV